MSRETMEWLNTNTRIGFTEKRGNAWHYREGTTNHFAGEVPVDNVEALMDSADPNVFDESCDCGCGVVTRVLKRKSNGHRYGTFTDGYQPHLYKQWLMRNVEVLLDDDLHIGSAGLLRGGAQAWVQVELSENITTKEGVTLRPNITAYTSFDGSLATAMMMMNQIVVCDNTLRAGIRQGGDVYKRRHTNGSAGEFKVADARTALQLLFANSDDFAAEVAELCAVTVTDRQWRRFLDIHKPTMLVDDKGNPLTGRALTTANNTRDQFQALWTHDTRVSPWSGTAYGVLAADNTYRQHFGIVRNVSRAERNMSNAIKGVTAKADMEAMRKLDLILAA